MQSNEQLVIARRLWDAIAHADVSELHKLLAEECVWRMPGSSQLAGMYVGPDEILEFMARSGELTVDLQSDLLDILASDGGAVLHYKIHAERGEEQLDTEHLFVIHSKDGQIVDAVFVPVDQAKYDDFFRPR